VGLVAPEWTSGPAWVRMVPLGLWLWQRVGVLWPWLRHQPEWQGGNWLLWHGQQGLMVSSLGLAIGTLLRREPHRFLTLPGLL
jgi:hypothetical protein